MKDYRPKSGNNQGESEESIFRGIRKHQQFRRIGPTRDKNHPEPGLKERNRRIHRKKTATGWRRQKELHPSSHRGKRKRRQGILSDRKRDQRKHAELERGMEKFVDLFEDKYPKAVKCLTKDEKENTDTTDLENQIDEMVYKLYDLTNEEIAIIEGSEK